MENNNNIRLCEHCKEEVAYNARRCPYCGSLLNNHAQSAYIWPQETVRPDTEDTNSNISSSNINDCNNINTSEANTYNDNNYNANNCDTNPHNNGQAYSEYIKQNNEQVNSAAEPGGFKEYKSYQQPVNNQVNYGTGYYGDTDVYDIKPLSNKTKVFLTALSSFVPWLGQLIGIIAAIVYMNSEDDEDRRSFGRALLVSSLIVFLITSFMILFTISAFSSIQ